MTANMSGPVPSLDLGSSAPLSERSGHEGRCRRRNLPALTLVLVVVAASVGETGVEAQATAPDPETEPRALAVDSNFELGASSNIFKDGKNLLWTDTVSGITTLGEDALSSSLDGWTSRETAVGFRALKNSVGNLTFQSYNTAVGADALYSNVTGFWNVAVGEGALTSSTGGYANAALGHRALHANTYGKLNTAVGQRALYSNTTGNSNVALGQGALVGNTTGSYNVAIGLSAGSSVTGSSNILINNFGFTGASNELRIGFGTGTSAGHLNKVIIHGIHGINPGSSDDVVINSNGQLGTPASSARFKQEIESIEDATRVLDLRPVRFRYRAEDEDVVNPLEYGLIAEEVVEVLPELVALDAQGEPFSVRYHLLSPLLLRELQRQNGVVRRQEQAIEALRRQAADRDRLIAKLERTLDQLMTETRVLNRGQPR